jgi:hypothetical protein
MYCVAIKQTLHIKWLTKYNVSISQKRFGHHSHYHMSFIAHGGHIVLGGYNLANWEIYTDQINQNVK